jgi:D-amino-acid dehydrogenase
MTHVAIIGAGITGVTTAYNLLERGFSVTVIDRERYAAMQTSFANGGQLSASNAEVWNHWFTVAKGLKWMLKRNAPLLLNPAPSWHKYLWLAEFIANIASYRENTVQTTRLAIAAREHLFSIAERERIDFDHERRGILHVYWDKPSFDHASKVNSLLTEGGLERRPVTPSEMLSIEPALRHGNLYGGFFTPSDSTGDIYKFTTGLAKACERRGGNFIFDADVDSVERNEKVQIRFRRKTSADGLCGSREILDADAIVVCAGSDSRRFAAMLGDRVNVYPVKGYSITVPLDNEESQKAAPWVSLLDDKAKIVTSRLGVDRLRVAGTAEFNGMNRDIRHDRIQPLIDWTRALFPDAETNRVVAWAGLRPMMPSMMPRVGRGKLPGVFYNTGHGHLGWTLAAATAQAVSEYVATQFANARDFAA